MEAINNSTNLLSFFIILAGAVLSTHNSEVGAQLITGGFGVFAGGQMRRQQLQTRSADPQPTVTPTVQEVKDDEIK